MSRKLSRGVALLATTLAVIVYARTSSGQITSVVSSDVEGFFGTTSDTFQQSEGPISPTWPASGLGFYPVTGLPNVPALYAGFPNPVLPVVPNIPFAGTHVLSSPFTDGTTTATYAINGGYNGPGTSTGDAYVLIGAPGALGMNLNQPNTATGYAYEQANFAISYSVGGGGILGGPIAPRPFQVSGNVITGGYAQFAAEVDYWWLTTTPGTTIVTGITNLGSLQYNFQINNVTGPFSALVNFAPTSLLGATGNGFLEITGDAFVAGDPFNITVESVPEPSAVVLLLIGLAGLGLHAVRRRKARAS